MAGRKSEKAWCVHTVSALAGRLHCLQRQATEIQTRPPQPPNRRTRAAAAVGDAEGLVQVEVAHVRTDDAGGSQAHLQVDDG